jgi:integrase
MNNITAAKQISTLKTLLNYARTVYKYQVNQDYRDFKVSRKDSELEVITVTEEEFLAIYNLDLSENKRLDPVRDVFCFACATGLRYSDLLDLRREHIRKDNTIRKTAVKTGQKLVIPLNPISYSILQKYVDHNSPLPVISNQKTNEYIKEIGELAGIDTPIEKVRTRGVKKITKVFKKYDLLSIHVGRKSFITLSLEKGIAMQDVMSLSGHTTFKAFKRYVDVNDNQKKTVMANAWGKVPYLKAK